MFAIPCILSHASAEGSESDRSCHRLVAIIVNKLAFAVGDDLFSSNNKKMLQNGIAPKCEFLSGKQLATLFMLQFTRPQKGEKWNT